MAPPPRPRHLRKDAVANAFKSSKPVVLSENPRMSLVPNINSISWSPVGTLVAHAMTGSIRVWNPERPDLKNSTEMRDPSLGKPVAHKDNNVERVVFNPCSEATLASTGKDAMVKLWDVRLPGGGAAAGGLGGATSGGFGKGGITNKAGDINVGDHGLFLTWHPGGSELLVGTNKDMVKALDIRKLNLPLLELPTTTTSTTTSLKYELVAEDRTPAKDDGVKWNYNQMTFSNSGCELIAGTSEGSVRIFDYPSLELLHTLRAHTSQAYTVKQSPTGQCIAVGSADSLITLWDTSSWLCTHVLSNQTTSVKDLSFSFDGAYLIAGAMSDGRLDASEKGLHIYHVDTGESAHMIETSNTVRDVAWHPLRYTIAYSGDPGGLKIISAT